MSGRNNNNNSNIFKQLERETHTTRGIDPTTFYKPIDLNIEPNQVINQFESTGDFDKDIDKVYEISEKVKPVHTDVMFTNNDLSYGADRKHNEDVQRYFNNRRYKYGDKIQVVDHLVKKLNSELDTLMREIINDTFVEDVADQPNLFRERFTDADGNVRLPLPPQYKPHYI